MNKCGHDDCFTCPFEDCICETTRKWSIYRKRYYERHYDEERARQKAWYQKNKDKISLERKLKKMSACKKCGKELNRPGHYPVYKGNYFCCEDCLKNFYLEKILDSYEEEWIDTEENLRIAAEEAKNEY